MSSLRNALFSRSRASGKLWIGIQICLCSVAFGAKDKQPVAGSLVWPEPPAEARIAYVQSFSNPSEAGMKSGGLRKFANWLAGAQEGNESLVRPFGLSVDDEGNLCITDTGVNAVCYFEIASKRWTRWDGMDGARFGSPVSAAKKGNTVFVADASLPGVVAFDLSGKVLFRITEPLTRASAVAVSGDRLLVVDTAAHSVVVCDLRGKRLTRFGVRGEGPGELNYPTHIATDRGGNIYVTDSINRRVQVFNSKGEYLRQIGEAGDSPGSFSRPKGVAVDSAGRVYVVDALFDNVQIFDSEARLLLNIGHGGTAPGEFWLPNGIAVGRDDRIYIADSYNKRVQVLEPVRKK